MSSCDLAKILEFYENFYLIGNAINVRIKYFDDFFNEINMHWIKMIGTIKN